MQALWLALVLLSRSTGEVNEPRRPTVLIVTTADAEVEAVVDRLVKVHQGYPKAVDKFPVKIGKLGGRVVVVCKTEQGIFRTYRDVLALLSTEYLKDSVKLVFAVGFAWGAKPASRGGNQGVGDVIVAKSFLETGHVRAGSGDVEIRSAVQETSLAKSVNSLLCTDWPRQSASHFGHERMPEQPRRPKAHIGTVISLPTLLDDKHATEELIGHPQIVPLRPIGGDMELYQMAAAADEKVKRWLFAKAICDFAGLDGAKNKDAQPLAAAAAADFADWILRQEVMNGYLGELSDDPPALDRTPNLNNLEAEDCAAEPHQALQGSPVPVEPRRHGAKDNKKKEDLMRDSQFVGFGGFVSVAVVALASCIRYFGFSKYDEVLISNSIALVFLFLFKITYSKL